MATPEDATPLDEGRTIVEPEQNEPQEAGSSGTDAPGAEWPDAEQPDIDRLGIERQEQDALLASVQLIGADALFDEAFYAAASGVGGGRGDLVTHYLTIGEPAFVSPSLEFDVRFYRDTNPDVVQSGGSALVHYLTHGRNERRYPNRRRLQRDAERVTASGLFDARVYAWDRGRPAQAGLSEAEDYLAARNHRAPIGQQFDSGFYAHVYDDLSGPGFTAPAIPILHYIDIGRAQLRVCNDRQLQREIEAGRTRFNEHYYLDQFRNRFPDEPLPADLLRHYILTGNRLGLDPAPDFSGDYYLRLYPDLRTSGMTPFYHFAAHGHAEGRVGRPDFTSVTSAGQAAFDGGKPTLLLASHEASRTGAPLVGLNVGARLADTHNVISYLGRAGPLLGDFAAHSCLLVVAPLSPLDAEYLLLHLKGTHRLAAVLLNSVETSNFAQAALQADLPSVALVHEFAEYTLPPGRMSEVIESIDRVITPATLIRDSVQAELLATRAGFANSIEVRPQGYLPRLPEDGAGDDLTREEILALIGADGSGAGGEAAPRVKLVLGAGYVQMRKGVDLFVQTAGEMRRLWGDDFRFVWVGDGYNPTADLQYSAWVADMVQRLDLGGHVFFLPVQSSLDRLFALSDVFFLPSRLDPFPNVALDAFRAGRAVVCFDRATGVADTLRDQLGHGAAAGAAVAYCNVTHAAEALIRLFDPAEVERALGNAALAQRVFEFGDYMGVIAAQLASAATLHDEAARAAKAILESGLFDAAFHENGPATIGTAAVHAATRAYVARGQKGLLRYNPRPGFNEGIARRRLRQPGPALDPNGSEPTHRCIILREDFGRGVTRAPLGLPGPFSSAVAAWA